MESLYLMPCVAVHFIFCNMKHKQTPQTYKCDSLSHSYTSCLCQMNKGQLQSSFVKVAVQFEITEVTKTIYCPEGSLATPPLLDPSKAFYTLKPS